MNSRIDDYQKAQETAAALLGVSVDKFRNALDKRGFGFMYRGDQPIFDPIRRIDTYNVEDIQDLWQYLIYPMRFYFDALAHTADVSTMSDSYKMDALLEWIAARQDILNNKQLFSESDLYQAQDGAFLYRSGYRLFRSKEHFANVDYKLPDGHDWLFIRRVEWFRDHDGMSMCRYIALYRIDGDMAEPPTSLHDVMTAAEAAEVYGIDHGTIRVSIHKGYITARKSGGTWLIARSDAERRWGQK